MQIGVQKTWSNCKPFSADAKLFLPVAEEVTEVDVEDLSFLRHHDVVRVSVL